MIHRFFIFQKKIVTKAKLCYIVENKEQALLITATMSAEGIEGWGARIDKMIQTITFNEDVEKTE